MDGQALTDWFTSTTLLGISLTSWAVACGAALLSYLVMAFALRFAVRRIAAVAERTTNRFDDILVAVLSGTNRGLVTLAALLIGLSMLDLPERWSNRVGQLWFVAVAVQFALWVSRAVAISLRLYAERHASGGANAPISASTTLASWGARTVIWAIVLLAVLSNLGVNITAFVASLGVGGIAVALAVQNILGDLFASLSIAVDKPFEVGDFIVVNGVSGTVENVGLKTTRIRALSGEQVVMSNTELLKQTINNYKRLLQRRILFGFGVTYSITPEQAEQIPALVQRLVEANQPVRFDRAHLKGFGESSIDYEVVYIVLDPAYNLYMDIQQRINLGLMRELAALGVEFAFPTRTVHVVQAVEEASEGPAAREAESAEARSGGASPILDAATRSGPAA